MKILVVDDESDFETLIIERFRKEIGAGQYEFICAEWSRGTAKIA